jgi:hypothetical protein
MLEAIDLPDLPGVGLHPIDPFLRRLCVDGRSMFRAKVAGQVDSPLPFVPAPPVVVNVEAGVQRRS